jgi:hypothetical protein
MSRITDYPDGYQLQPGDRILASRQGRTISVSGAGVTAGATQADQFADYKAFTDQRITGLTQTINNLVNLVEAVTGGPVLALNTLLLSSTAFTAGTMFYSNISGLTAGSLVEATADDGTTLNVTDGLLSGTFVTPGSKTITLTETLAGAINSPNITQIPVAVSDGVVIPTPTLTATPAATSIAANAPSGTLISNITNVPAGVTPTVTPNDGRFVIAGDATSGWKVVTGLSALSAGSATLTVAATGATPATITLTITAVGTALSITGTPPAGTVGSNPTFTPTVSGGTAPYTLSLLSGTLPPGRVINGSAGTVTGAYTTAGSYSYVLRVTDSVGGTADLPVTITVSATTTLANLAQVANTQMATNAAETWWSEQTSVNPAGTYAVKGFTDNTGLQYIAEFTLATSTKTPTDTRRIESPRFFLPDEHNEQPCAYTSTGALWLAITGHSNAANNTADGNARILFFYSATGRIADLQQAYTFLLSGSSVTAGTNYGYWIEKPDGTMLFLTNQDADASWRFIGFPSGDYKQPVEYKSIARNTPSGGGGQNQLYCIPSRISSNVLELNFMPHASNARNTIQSFDVDLTTGAVTGNSASFGNAFSTYADTTALVDFSTTAVPTTIGTVKPNADPGAGRSIRIMDAVGRGFGGATFASNDASSPIHFWSEGSTLVDLGNPGTALDTARRYFRGLKRAREMTGYRWYRCFTDGTNDTLERIDAPSLGGTLTRQAMFTSTTQKVTRPFVFQRATPAMSVVVPIGSYTSFVSFNTGMQVFASTDTVAVSPNVEISAAQLKAEGNSGANVYTYMVTRSATTGAVNVPWTFAAGNTSADDYTGATLPTGGTVALADGVASGTFTVSVNGDVTFEQDETFTVSITPPSGYIAGARTSATGTITNDDTQAVSGPNTVISQAAFSNSSGSDIDLALYTSEVGGGWKNISVGGGVAFVSAAIGKVRKGPTTPGGHAAYTTVAAPTSANYDIEVDLTYATVVTALVVFKTGDTANNFLGAGYSTSSGYVIGNRASGGSFTSLNATNETPAAGSTVRLKVQVRTNTITLLVDSGAGYVQKATTTTTLSYGTAIGLNFANTGYSGSDTVGALFDNWKVTDNVT